MTDSIPAGAAEATATKPRWPKYSLLFSAFLWLLAWEAIVSFVPVQPRVVIASHKVETEEVDTDYSEYFMGFLPDGRALVTTMGYDPNEPGQIYRLWDVNTGQDLGTFGRKDKTILPNVVYLSQRDLLGEITFPIKPHIDSTYIIYDLTSHRETATIELERREDGEDQICFSPDGKTLAFGTYSKKHGALRLLEVATGRVLADFHGEEFGCFNELIFSQDGSRFMTTVRKRNPNGKLSHDQKVIVLDVTTGKITRTFNHLGSRACRAALSPDGILLAISFWNASGDSLEIWDLATGKLKKTFPEGFNGFFPDGKGFITLDRDQMTFCDINTGRQYSGSHVSGATIGPNQSGLADPVPIPGTRLLTVPSGTNPSFFYEWFGRFLRLRNRANSESTSQLEFLDTTNGHKVGAVEMPVIDGAISPDGKTLAVPISNFKEGESSIELWDIPPRKPLRWVLGLLAIPSMVTLFTICRWRKASR
jgi:WD40 repeat protein